MRVYFLHHSAVCVFLDTALLIFDHYLYKADGRLEAGTISAKDIAGAERVYVFVSHAHHDHFNTRIFDWADGHVKYVLDDTVPKAGAPQSAVYLHRGDEYSDDVVYVRAFGSTDCGGSFYVSCEGTSFFHAGDFNDWHWKDDGNVRYTRVMGKLFERELRHIRHRVETIDYAFFPLDRRMGSDFDAGADRFIEVMQPKCLIPIHFKRFGDTHEYSNKMKDSGTHVLPVHKNGERLV